MNASQHTQLNLRIPPYRFVFFVHLFMNPEQGIETALALHKTRWCTFTEWCATLFLTKATLEENNCARSNETRQMDTTVELHDENIGS